MSNIIKWWRNFGNNGVLTGYGGIASKSALLRMEGHKVLEQKDSWDWSALQIGMKRSWLSGCPDG